MRKSPLPFILILLCLLVAGGAGTWVALNLTELNQSPFETRTNFFFPYVTAVDDAGRSYVVDTAMRRIVALDRDGTLRWTLDGGQRSAGFYYAHQLAVDAQDRLYVYNWVPYAGADFRAEEVQIQRYSPDGHLEKTLFRWQNPNGSDDFPLYFGFFLDQAALYTISGDGHTLSLSRSDLDGGQTTLLRTLPSTRDFVAITGQPDGTLFGVARNGSLWTAPTGADWLAIDLPQLRKPWDVKVDADGSLLILDLLQGVIYRRTTGGELQAVLSTKTTGGVFSDTFALSPKGTLVVADKAKQRVIVAPRGAPPAAFEGATWSQAGKLVLWSVWGAVGLGGLALVVAIGLIYFFVFQRRLPLLLIQLVIFVPIILTTQAVAFNQVYDTLKTRYQSQVRDTLLNSAHLVANLLPNDQIQSLHQPADLDSPAYDQLRQTALDIRKQGQDTGAFNFIAIYRLIDGQPCYVYTGSGTFGVNYPYTLLPPESLSLFNQAGSFYTQYADDYGIYDSAFASIVGSDGRPAAVVEVGLFADLIKDMENTYLAGARLFALISGLVFALLFSLLTLLMLKSLNSLRRMTREIARGNLDLPVELKTRDEIGQLGQDFAAMSGRLKSYLQDITALTAASARFVPRDFIDLLGVNDLTELRLGDQTSRDMTIMFCSVLNFRKVTGHLSAQGVFNYLNSYLASTVPLIRLNKGIVDKFIGDTFMALFPGSPGDAVRSFTEINRRVQTHNAKRSHSGSETLQVSFGLHLGSLMLGIVGEQQRLEGTVIADSVNLTSRLNGLCRIYGVSNVISRATLDHLPGVTYRRLDHVMVKGKSEPILICEILDPDDERQKLLLTYLNEWEAAFDCWERGDLDAAEQQFDFLEYKIPDDPVVHRLSQRIGQMLKAGRPEPWTPAVKLSEK